MFKKLLTVLAFIVSGAGFATADTVLTLVDSSASGTAKVVELSMEELQAFPQYDVATENDYVDGKPVFTGPLMRDVMARLDANGGQTATLYAVDDYNTKAPMEEAMQYNVILALQKDGKPLSRRGKGPIWVIYPMSDHEELRRPEINGRLVWQLAKIEVSN